MRASREAPQHCGASSFERQLQLLPDPLASRLALIAMPLVATPWNQVRMVFTNDGNNDSGFDGFDLGGWQDSQPAPRPQTPLAALPKLLLLSVPERSPAATSGPQAVFAGASEQPCQAMWLRGHAFLPTR